MAQARNPRLSRAAREGVARGGWSPLAKAAWRIYFILPMIVNNAEVLDVWMFKRTILESPSSEIAFHGISKKLFIWSFHASHRMTEDFVVIHV